MQRVKGTEVKVSWSPVTASIPGKGQQKSISLPIPTAFSFYLHQKSRNKIVVVQIYIHNPFEISHKWLDEDEKKITESFSLIISWVLFIFYFPGLF